MNGPAPLSRAVGEGLGVREKMQACIQNRSRTEVK
jgi:hypothetical protein